jgi:FMN phosphatase YigB (HAD superfamily)
MISPKLSASQFECVAHRIDQQGVELVVSDFNGVLDDYYGTKYEFIGAVLGSEYQDQHFARLALQTDTAYIQDRRATLEDTITSYCQSNGIEMSADGKEILEVGPRKPVITPEARQFLGALSVPVVIFTAQKPERLYQSVEREFLEDLNIGVVASVVKPSVDSLAGVLSSRGVAANEACMVGDGLIDDLLPAKLLGMHTVLVSPFADMHVSE